MNAVADTHPWCPGQLTDQPVLIIAGGYRCGTTALFNQLAGLNEISPCRVKEPAFFFSLRWSENPPAYPPGQEARAYLRLFPSPSGKTLLEATSNYLSDRGSAARIRRALPKARVIVLMRDPVARLRSWFRFLQFQGYLAGDLEFDAWVRTQLAGVPAALRDNYAWQAVRHCRYAEDLADYLRVFGQQAVLPLWFDDLRQDPGATLERVCAFAGLASRPAAPPTMWQRNPSPRLARPRAFALYRLVLRSLLYPLKPWPMRRFDLATRLFGQLEPRILPWFLGAADSVQIAPELETQLRAHFAADAAALEELLGERPPWVAEA